MKILRTLGELSAHLLNRVIVMEDDDLIVPEGGGGLIAEGLHKV